MSAAALSPWLAARAASPLEAALVGALGRATGAPLPLPVALGVVAASTAVRRGAVCADLAHLIADGVRDDDGARVDGLTWPALADWLAALDASPICGGPGAHSPLVREGSRLTLRRLWAHEARLADALRARDIPLTTGVDDAALRDGLARLFPEAGAKVDAQAIAAATAATRPFAVITGGPGTGKTTTVVKVLALLVEQALAAGKGPPAILLLAPTGKAAARLSESIRGARGRLNVPEEVRAAIPDAASTIHRALGTIPGPAGGFRHGPEAPLPADVVLVDEASMVDLALMDRLVAATPRSARLLLLGDRDQLASVDAGAILGDLCAARRPARSAPARAALVRWGLALPAEDAPAPASPSLADAIVHLTHSHRFDPTRGIGRLATALRAGDAGEAAAVLRDGPADEVALHPGLSGEVLPGPLADDLLSTATAMADAASHPARALQAFGGFRILCAHRRGPAGVASLNRLAESLLQKQRIIDRRLGAFYALRPVLITENDHPQSLYNGDVGLTLPVGPGGALRVCFPTAEGGVRLVVPERLPPHETTWAMTVHKSQGSEFGAVAVVLPSDDGPLLTRELIYTAVTRARSRVALFGDVARVRTACARPVQRASGLQDRLWGPAPA